MIYFNWKDAPWWTFPVCVILALIMGIILACIGNSATASEPDAPTPMIETMEEQQW